VLILILLVVVVIGVLVYVNGRTVGGGGRPKAGPAAPPAAPPPPVRAPAPGWVCALDLGTHAAKAAVWAPGEEPRVVTFGAEPTLPAAVGLDGKGAWLVGAEAMTYAQHYPFAVLRNPKGAVNRREVLLTGPGGTWRAAPTDLMAATLDVLYRTATAHAPPGPLLEIVLTHPVTWADNGGVDVLRAALARAVVPDVPVTLVSEPVAAAAWCDHYHRDVTGTGVPYVVADIGGGSLDVALLQSGSGGTTILGQVWGRDDVGGNALDAALLACAGARWAVGREDHWRRFADEPGPEWEAARRQCDDNARLTKENLSALERTTLRLACPEWSDDVDVTRPQFDHWVERIVRAITRVVDTAAQTYGMGVGTPVFLSGGSSRVPLVRAYLEGRGFAVVAPDAGGPAELIVVRGAALLSRELGRVPG
jgi:molecular chaperone DnaK (HSP70)